MENLKSTQQYSTPPQEAVFVEPSAKLRVHLVDDNQEAVDSLAQWMSLFGYETRVSYAGQEALDAAQTFQPDVMLIDIKLPGMDGYQLASSLRDKDTFQRVVFIAVTGLKEREYEGMSGKAPFNLHFA